MGPWPDGTQAAVYVPPALTVAPVSREDLMVRLAGARVREGLPADGERLEALMQSGYAADPDRTGIYTASERRDLAGDQARVEAVRAALADAGEVLGGVQVCWRAGRRAVRVRLTGELERWQARLAQVIEPRRLIVEQVEHGEAELRRRGGQVRAQFEELAAQGIAITFCGTTIEGFRIEYLAADRALAERVMRRRFGDFATLHYRGASHHSFTAFPFASWLAEGRQLHVFYGLPHNGEQPAGCQKLETETAVVVALFIKDWRGAKTLVGGFTPTHATVELEAPLGDRDVIDSAQNLARPHWTRA